MCNSTTVLSYIENMDSIKSETCNNVVDRTRDFCIAHKLWISVAHIPGIEKNEVDEQPKCWKIQQNGRFPVDTRRCFNVDTTSYDIVQRRIDVETTSYVYGD